MPIPTLLFNRSRPFLIRTFEIDTHDELKSSALTQEKILQEIREVSLIQTSILKLSQNYHQWIIHRELHFQVIFSFPL